MGIARRLISIEGDVNPFIFRIQTDTDNRQYELPLYPADLREPSIYVDWGDGSSSVITANNSPDKIHVYATAGTYDITITGVLTGFRVDNNSNYRGLYRSVISWGNVGLISISFYGCNNLTSIPTSDFDGLNSVINWNNTFRASGLTSIPAGMFDQSTISETFVDTFSYTYITSVPDNLFDYNTSATSFSSCFNACTSLTTVPNELFRYNTQVINFSSTFRNCRALIELPTFDYNQNVTIFLNLANMSTSVNALSGAAEEIWLRSPQPLGTNAFNNCFGLSNYAAIPVNFK
jgi:hypothetical protein